MAIASGIAKQLVYKVESAWGTAPGATAAQYLRRVESTLDLSKETYVSNEIRTDYQIADFRHGVRRVQGAIRGELSPGTYEDFIAAALRRDFTVVTSISAVSLTVAAGAGSTWTVTRAAGSYLTDGMKVGHVFRITTGLANAANINKNLLVVTLTATIATVVTLNGSAMAAEGPTSSTIAFTGKVTYTPTTGHTDKSFYIEHFYSDIAQSERFSGCKMESVGIDLPTTGIATVEFGVMGKDMTSATAAYYTTPTALTTSGCLAAVNGVLLLAGTAIATVTAMNIRVAGGYTADPVVGANTVPAIVPGRVNVSGQFSAFFENATARDYFVNETEISLIAALTSSNADAAEFVSFVMPRIKVGGASKTDGERGIVATFPFQALFNSAGGAGVATEATTLLVQDSLA